MDFEIGQVYRRSDIHKKYAGQSQGGISTPARHKLIFLFTGESGTQHGYNDGWADGVYCYFGEGQKGDMSWRGGNKAIRDHWADGKELLLFQSLKTPRSYVRFMGNFSVASWEHRKAPDKDGLLRNAFVFNLVPQQVNSEINLTLDLQVQKFEVLRKSAIEAGNTTPLVVTKSALKNYISRSALIRAYALTRANGHCENCGKVAPFLTSDKIPFLEVHHIFRLSDGGPDRVESVAAICPNCHREAHFGSNKDELNKTLGQQIRAKEASYSPKNPAATLLK